LENQDRKQNQSQNDPTHKQQGQPGQGNQQNQQGGQKSPQSDWDKNQDKERKQA
jgi:hypothetical protein